MDTEVKVVITKEDAPYATEEWLGEYTIRRWTWREKQRAAAKSTNILDAKKAISEFDVVEYETQMLLACIKTAPFPVNDKPEVYERLLMVDMDVGDKLADAARKVNGITEMEVRDFLPPGEEENPTSG